MSGKTKEFDKVIIVYDYAYINGGAANVAIQTAITLSEKYKSYYFAAVGPVCEELLNSEVNVTCLEMDDINTAGRIDAVINGVWNRAARKSFGTFLKSFDPKRTILHIHGWSKALSVSVVAEAEKQGFLPVITLYDYFSVCPNGGFYDYKKCGICELECMNLKCLSRNCDKRSYPQKLWRCLRQAVQDRYVKNNPDVVYFSISDLNELLVKRAVKSDKFFRVDNPVRLAEKKNDSLPENYQFICVGRISEEKGVELFCQAIERAKETVPEIEGIVIGDGDKCEELKEKYEQIEFVGWKTTDQVQEYMRMARALVFPSKWYETFGLTVAEAMSAGTPCIVSDVTAAAENILDGQNGLIFKSDDLNEVSKCIVSACDDEIWRGLHNSISDNFVPDYYSLCDYSRRLIRAYCIAAEEIK